VQTGALNEKKNFLRECRKRGVCRHETGGKLNTIAKIEKELPRGEGKKKAGPEKSFGRGDCQPLKWGGERKGDGTTNPKCIEERLGEEKKKNLALGGGLVNGKGKVRVCRREIGIYVRVRNPVFGKTGIKRRGAGAGRELGGQSKKKGLGTPLFFKGGPKKKFSGNHGGKLSTLLEGR